MAREADRDRADDAMAGLRGAADHDHHGVIRMRIADGGGCRDQFPGDEATAPLELPRDSAVVQLRGGRGTQLLLHFAEIGFHLGESVRRHHVHAGHVGDVDDVDAAVPAQQQGGRRA